VGGGHFQQPHCATAVPFLRVVATATHTSTNNSRIKWKHDHTRRWWRRSGLLSSSSWPTLWHRRPFTNKHAAFFLYYDQWPIPPPPPSPPRVAVPTTMLLVEAWTLLVARKRSIPQWYPSCQSRTWLQRHQNMCALHCAVLHCAVLHCTGHGMNKKKNVVNVLWLFQASMHLRKKRQHGIQFYYYLGWHLRRERAAGTVGRQDYSCCQFLDPKALNLAAKPSRKATHLIIRRDIAHRFYVNGEYRKSAGLFTARSLWSDTTSSDFGAWLDFSWTLIQKKMLIDVGVPYINQYRVSNRGVQLDGYSGVLSNFNITSRLATCLVLLLLVVAASLLLTVLVRNLTRYLVL